jgi:hypothetical protein
MGGGDDRSGAAYPRAHAPVEIAHVVVRVADTLRTVATR